MMSVYFMTKICRSKGCKMETAVYGAQDDYARFKMKYNFNRYPTNSKLHFGFISVRLCPTKFQSTMTYFG